MSRIIHRLPNEVACQIAAGEVIERPLSVVKELFENALDANATQIHIEISAAGLGQIKISDNGHGIFEEDLLLALEPHCTSKIKVLNDLYSINSKGFRGEALASIASVSKMSIVSKPSTQLYAQELCAEGGVYAIKPVSRSVGTSVSVLDLFYNTPVRKKFLKSPAYEWMAIENLVKRFALLAMNVAIVLKHDDETILNLIAAQNEKEKFARVKKIVGKSFEKAQYVDISRSNLHIYGWLGALAEHKSQNDKIWIYLNGRVLQDKLILHALKQLYMHLLPPGRHPQMVLYLEVPKDLVDINVHPAKTEVRFEQPRLIYDFIISSLKDYFNPFDESMVTTDRTPTLDALLQQQEALSYQSVSPWTICNTQYIVLSKLPHYYLVDIKAWWHQHILKKDEDSHGPWEPRLLTMPYVQDIKKISSTLLEAIVEQARYYGIEMQAFGEEKICIRSIPACLPQFDLNAWVKYLNQVNKVCDIKIEAILACANFSAFDISMPIFQQILTDLDNTSLVTYAKLLSIDNCKAFFK